ncbi:hypothetical protein [Flavobacterium sp. GT3R68]|uniref:hypothetical protein n=1 Tax=Flavobacterium sp. GT3R68 TaxID=2594437 RepID=UPI000F88948B|nr:hypothetical protein [Flavobacterium sp. GT3R68]RTY91783.1 hypothetical protein EKL32_18130 [Flavobacterium sp. GSN2]TRW90123.1 hypothetical protein FNW07_11740 [Flavobacterium sp. GT3R68]
MIKQVKKSKFKKIIAIYLAMMILLETLQPLQMYALTSGPTQPEFNSFTPIGTSDMVDLTSGDFNYNIPVMDVGGYPLNLAYNSGVTMDQEASWVGLGWNLNVGQIERQVRGLPDDFKGDQIKYENNTRDNVTVGMNLGVNAAAFGWDGVNLGAGLAVESNNYEGISFKPSMGVGFELSDNVSVGMNLSSSVADGASVTPSVSISRKGKEQSDGSVTSLSSSLSLGLSSRKGVENLNLSASVSQKYAKKADNINANTPAKHRGSGTGIGGSISFNNQSYTPSKRIGYDNSSFNFNAAVGGEVFGIEGQVQVTGYGSYQSISPEYKVRPEKAFGYENTQYKNDQSGVLDFNRINERVITERTTSLPSTNYTYDTYNIDGQGVAGMFRPYRSKVSTVYNDMVVDNGSGGSYGAELGLGNLFHGSADFKSNSTTSSTGPWITNNNALPYFKEGSNDPKTIDYEPCTFKMVGATAVDPEQNIYETIHRTNAMQVAITGGNKNGTATPNFFVKGDVLPKPISEIRRQKRFLRNQVIQKVTNKEAERDLFVKYRTEYFAKPHHTSGMKVLKTDGSTYVYGQTAYNTKKIEATFDVSSRNGDNKTGEVPYYALADNSVNGTLNSNNGLGSDQYLNKITTPGYAHSYMLTTVLSSDYEDVDNNGPSIKDLGSYTQFDYTTTDSIYKWRIPFESKKATYNNGLYSKKQDQKGNYIYGKKELLYVNKIVTKTHVAFFDLAARKDARGVMNEAGGMGPGKMQKLKSIRLYSLPEVTNAAGQIVDPGINGSIKPIKTAHFIYSYSLCKGMPNNIVANPIDPNDLVLDANELHNYGGKLTLKKVYFTYRGSNMGKYTPYEFDYNENDAGYKMDVILGGNLNHVNADCPKYDSKGFDIWGNYKPNLGTGVVNSAIPTNTEFPFVDQINIDIATVKDATADAKIYTAVWNLKTISLPSGGKITLETESDDYQYVQNKKAMQMFNVIGAGAVPNPTETDIIKNKLYTGSTHNDYLYVQLSKSATSHPLLNEQQFKNDYLGENYDKAIQFRFLLNMRSDNNWQYEYVQGYFKIKKSKSIGIVRNGLGTFAAIPLEPLQRGGGTNGGMLVNPIAKAGWGFGRSFLNTVVYGQDPDPTEKDFESIVNALRGSIKAISEIFKGPNKALQDKGCARVFNPAKSWVRLETGTGKKLGGGLRVKSIKLSDQWTTMLTPAGGTNMEYGQTYSYTESDVVNAKSSGVATFEPNACSENPLVEPFYNNSGSYADNIAAPMESNYVEKPFGENFFPAAKVTYSRVVVKNLPRIESGGSVKKHATGMVVTEHYTTYDFPTKVEYTNMNAIPDITPNDLIGSMLRNGNVNVKNHLTMSQGYAIETNDMNGKIKSQKVYKEGATGNDVLSSVEYIYNFDANNNIDSNLTTIDSQGKVSKKLIGLDYDLINDFSENFSSTLSSGVDANLMSFLTPSVPPIAVFVPTMFPKNFSSESVLRTAVTTKHVHKTGILVEKIAYDLGARVSTKNIAWDAGSGEVILTETVNEYNDHYFSFTYPAYWMYDGMGLASQNIGIEGDLVPFAAATPPSSSPVYTNFPHFSLKDYTADLSNVFHVGDELSVLSGIVQSSSVNNINMPAQYKVWVIGFKKDTNGKNIGVLLMDAAGHYINTCLDLGTFHFKIVRSGYRNLQSASMASVTSMTNPIKITNNPVLGDGTLHQNSFLYDGSGANPRIINASAVEYKDLWNTQSEAMIPYYPEYDPYSSNPVNNPVTNVGLPNYPYNVLVNPYVWNIKGEWRAEKSYAYLTGRKPSNGAINNPRNEGFFTTFSPYYHYDLINGWFKVPSIWQSASTITKYNPYGAEVENEDALGRHSSAQYGYQYKLPMAVASNSRYEQIGYEGFEEKKSGLSGKHFGFDIDNPANISANHSHTGKNSIKVDRNQSVLLGRTLKPVIRTTNLAQCPTTTPPPGPCYLTKTVLSGSGNAAWYGYTFKFAAMDDVILQSVNHAPGSSSHPYNIYVLGSDLIMAVGSNGYYTGAYCLEDIEVVVKVNGVFKTVHWSLGRCAVNMGTPENPDWDFHGTEGTYCFTNPGQE